MTEYARRAAAWSLPVMLGVVCLVLEMTASGQALLHTPAPDAAAPGVLSGRVVSGVGGASPQPVNRARVTAAGSGFRRVTITDRNGEFRIGGLPAGRYAVTASKAGYVDTAYGSVRVGGPGVPVVLAAGETAAGLTVHLVPGGAIAGTVLGLDGASAPNLPVRARLVDRPDESAGSYASTLTDDRGEYRLFGLVPGAYLVEVGTGAPARAAMRVMSAAEIDRVLNALERLHGVARGVPALAREPALAVAEPDSAAHYSYAPTWFPSTAAPDEAVPVALGAGEERLGIDIMLVLAGTVAVTGRIVHGDGREAAGASVAVAHGSRASALGLRPLSATTRTDGTFRVVNVTPGSYVVHARIVERGRGAAPRATAWARADVAVGTGPVHGLLLTLRPALTWSGRVVVEAGQTQSLPQSGSLRIVLTPRPVPESAGALPLSADVRSDGSFTVEGITPGAYDLAISIAGADRDGWWAESAIADGVELLDSGFTVTSNPSPPGGGVVRITARRPSLAGSLANLSGRPAPEYLVVAFPADPELRISRRRMVSARPDTSGRFVLRDLPPGDYHVAVIEDTAPAVWQAPAFLESLASHSVRATLTGGSQTLPPLQVQR